MCLTEEYQGIRVTHFKILIWQIKSEYVSHGRVSGYQGDAAADKDAGFSGQRSPIRLPLEY